jgi:hypothetical protein
MFQLCIFKSINFIIYVILVSENLWEIITGKVWLLT